MNSISPRFLLGIIGVIAFATPLLQDRNPEAINTVVPVLKSALLGIQAEVVLVVDINAHGYVTDAKIKSSSNPELSQPCLDAIRKWKFTPAVIGGKAVAATIIQSLRFGDQMVSTEPISSTRPKVLRTVKPDLPESLRHITGAATVLLKLDDEGKIYEEVIQSSTNEELNNPCLQALQQWSFAPAIKDGKPIKSAVYVPFLFVGTEMKEEAVATAEQVDNRELVPVRQMSPSIPSHLSHINAETEISFAVDKNGFVSNARVKSTTNAELAEIAKQTVLEWRFRPIVKGGAAVAVKAVQPFRFGNGAIAIAKIDMMPTAIHEVVPQLPESLSDVSGSVKVLFHLSSNGAVTHVEAKESTLAELEAPVLAAAKQWKFKPALKAGEPVESKVIIPFVFGK